MQRPPGRDGQGLRVHDRLPVRLYPLDAAEADAARNGRLGAQTRGPSASGAQAASVEDILAGFPRDQQLDPPLAESLKLLDTKLSHLLNLLEEQHRQDDAEGPAEVSLVVGLGEVELLLTGEEAGVEVPETQGWAWLEMPLPGLPRSVFGVPVTVSERETLGPDSAPVRERARLRLQNVTETEEQVLSEYLFRRHRQEIRQWRGREGGGAED